MILQIYFYIKSLIDIFGLHRKPIIVLKPLMILFYDKPKH